MMSAPVRSHLAYHQRFEAALVTDVSLLRNPVNLDELNALIGEVLKRPRRSRLAQLRTTGAKLGHDEPHSEVVC